MRLMNDFQKEVTTFWIRHPEKWDVPFRLSKIWYTWNLEAVTNKDISSKADKSDKSFLNI